MIFKNKRDERCWKFVHEKLRSNIEETDRYCQDKHGLELVITDTVRLFSEQTAMNNALIAKDPTYKAPKGGVHCYGNGADAGQYSADGHRFTPEQMNDVQMWYNARFPYGFGAIKSCLIHVGTALHFHFQINSRLYGIGYNPDNQEAMKVVLEAIRGQG